MEWKNKINQFELDPPPLAWKTIENELHLDEGRLYNYAACPPEGVWDEISAHLLPIGPQKTSVFRGGWHLLRYAAMVAFLVLMGTTILNKPFRNALFETVQGPGMKASLNDTPHAVKNDTSTNKKHHSHLP
jgi:hypothetical protein